MTIFLLISCVSFNLFANDVRQQANAFIADSRKSWTKNIESQGKDFLNSLDDPFKGKKPKKDSFFEFNNNENVVVQNGVIANEQSKHLQGSNQIVTSSTENIIHRGNNGSYVTSNIPKTRGRKVHKRCTSCVKGRLNPNEELAHVGKNSQLLIFISFSMPKESIKSYAVEAQKVGARLVVRGFIDNDILKTAKYIAELGSPEIEIHPPLFTKYKIKVVPTFVHVSSTIESGVPFDLLKGHVSVEHVLMQFKNRGEVLGIDDYIAKWRSKDA